MSRRGVWVWVGAVICIVLARTALAAQGSSDVYGRTVTSVTFELEGQPYSSPAVSAMVDVAVGKPLRLADVRASEEHLAAIYDDVTPVAAPNATGVDVTFRLVPRHPVTKLVVAGDTGIPSGTLKNRIQERFGGVPTGVPVSQIVAATTQILNDNGYLGASVTSTLELQHAPEAATLVLTAHAGPLTHILQTDVTAQILTVAEVIERTRTEAGQPYHPREIDTALTAIEDGLRTRGYYEAQATIDPPAETPEGVKLHIDVDPGPLVRIRIDPPGALPGGMDELIPVDRERSADEDLLDDSKKSIEQALQDLGYAEATVTFTQSLEQNNTELIVTFHIDRGQRYSVDRVALKAGLSLSDDAIRALIGISPGAVFSEAKFHAGVNRVLAEYRRLGYYTAAAQPDYEPAAPSGAGATRMILQPNITEGPRGQIAAVRFTFQGPHQLSDRDLDAVMHERVGQPFGDADMLADRERVRTFYTGRGFRDVSAVASRTTADDGTNVTITFTITEGQQTRVGEITIAGNERVTTNLIRDELHLTPGQPLGAGALTDAQARLSQLGVFRRVSVTAGPSDPQGAAPIVVSVVEAPATSIGFGGGLEGFTTPRSVVGGGTEDKLEFSPGGFVQLDRQGLGGRNRSLDFYARTNLRPRDAPGNPALDGKGLVFSDYLVSTTYRERRAFHSDTDLYFGASVEQGVQTTFDYARQAGDVQLVHHLSPRLSLSGRYTLESTRLFDERISPDEQLPIDRLFPQVRLSYFSSSTSWDTRDNPLAPARGSFISAEGSIAARAIGSQVGFVKTLVQASRFHGIGANHRTVLAGRAEVGAAHGFPRTGLITDPTTGQEVETTVEDLPASERFFAGGATSVRGFQEDRLGVPAIIDPTTGLSLGGNGVIVLNAEIRQVVGKLFGRNFSTVGFLDAGNVFALASQLNLDEIRAALGFGVRYDSPLGPVRLDLGFKLNHQEFDDRGWEYHLSIGEAF